MKEWKNGIGNDGSMKQVNNMKTRKSKEFWVNPRPLRWWAFSTRRSTESPGGFLSSVPWVPDLAGSSGWTNHSWRKGLPESSRHSQEITIDVVDIFRGSANVPPVVEESIEHGAKVVWMQEE